MTAAQATASIEELRGLGIEIDDPSRLKDPRYAEKFGQLVELRKANPLIGYHPHGKQEPFHKARRQVKVFVGGERSGKTLGGTMDDLINAVDVEVVPPWLGEYKIWGLDEPFTCRVILPDYGQGYQEYLNTLQAWCPGSQLYKGEWEHAYSERNHKVQFANGSFFDFMTQEQDLLKFGGTSRQRLHYDEEPKGHKGEMIREANVSRLIQYRGDELFTFSPVNGLGTIGHDLWEGRGTEIAKEVWDKPEGDEDSPSMVLVVANQDDNPYLSEEGKREAEAKMGEKMREARTKGLFVHAEGLVYPSFSEELHVCDPLDPEFVAGLEQFDCIDPGNNMAVLFAGFDSDNVLWVYDELFLTGTDAIPANTVAKMRELRVEKWGLPEKPKRTLIDPASAAMHHQTNKRTDALFREAGLFTIPADNAVEAGIQEMRGRLDNCNDQGDPQPLIQIARNCEGLLWERRRYRMEIEDGKIVPIKENDHREDCGRYISMQRKRKERKRRPRRPAYVPGEAPPVRKRKRGRSGGPMGRFT